MQLIGVTAMNVAVRQRNPNATISYDAICSCFQGIYTEQRVYRGAFNSCFFIQIKAVEQLIIRKVVSIFALPVAPTFLEFFLGAMSEFSAPDLRWACPAVVVLLESISLIWIFT